MKTYKVAAIYGSPRRDGNTDTMLNRFLEGLASSTRITSPGDIKLIIEKIIIEKLDISPCRECRHCSIDGQCAINDQMQEIYPIIIEADLVAVASPIFFTSTPGYLKSFIDRFQRFWALKYELKRNIFEANEKKGLLFSCSGTDKKDIFECTKKIMKAFFDVINVKYFQDFLYNNIDFKGDILKKPQMLLEVFNFGRDGTFLN